MSDRIVGIDLGTSNTVVAIVDEMDRVRVLPDSEGHTVHPSVVSFHPSGGVVVGVKGKQRKVLDPRHTIYSAKRMIGQPFRSFAVTETARRVPFEIKEGPNEQAIVVTRAGEFAIPEISAIVLDHVRKIASKALDHEVSRAVVTVPASFTDVQRASTANAGALAGLTVVRVLNEPTAAALAYGANKRLSEIIAVYDFGGGTFDITILQLEDQVYTVLGTSGDAFLGGEDIDERLVDRMVKDFYAQHRVDLREDDVSMMRLRAVAEHTKIELSRRSRAVVKIEEVAYAKDGSPLHLTAEVSRDELVSSLRDLVDRTFVSCKEALALANIAPDRIADVILVGGTTRIPYVRDQVTRFFAKAPRFDVNPDDAIATGAALQASSIEQMLSRGPKRASIPPVPVDSLVSGVLVDKTASPAPAAPKAARRKDDPETIAARGKAFFGDLFGDRPAQPVAPQPAPPAARSRRASESLDWEPPAGSAFADDPDAVDVFAPEPASSAEAQIADLSDQVTEEPAGGSDLAIELAEPSMPAIRLTDEDLVPVEPIETKRRPARTLDDADFGIPPTATPAPSPTTRLASPTRSALRPSNDDDIKIEVSMPAIQLDEPPSGRTRRPPVSPTALPALPRVSTTRSAPPGRPPVRTLDDDLAIGNPARMPPGTPMPAEVDELAIDVAMPVALDDVDDAPRATPKAAAPRRAPLELDWAPPPGAELKPSPSPSPSFELDIDSVAPLRADDFSVDVDLPPPKELRPEPGYVLPAHASPAMAALSAQAAAPPPPRVAAVIDVTPRGLGIATVAGFCEELIRRNESLPAAVRRSFGTSRDGQDTVRIVICQGESRRLDNNVVIGDLVLPNLPRRPRGETRIEVEFVLDSSGILQVSARDAATGAEQRANLDLKGGMAPEELDAAARRLQRLANVPLVDDE